MGGRRRIESPLSPLSPSAARVLPLGLSALLWVAGLLCVSLPCSASVSPAGGGLVVSGDTHLRDDGEPVRVWCVCVVCVGGSWRNCAALAGVPGRSESLGAAAGRRHPRAAVSSARRVRDARGRG
jgi:hypothetical protein